jgi:peroxiredoxin family protein
MSRIVALVSLSGSGSPTMIIVSPLFIARLTNNNGVTYFMQATVTKNVPVTAPLQAPETGTKNRLAIVLFSGTVDKLMPVAVLASAAVTLGMDVDVFATFWGLNAFRKDVVKTNMKFSKDFEEMAGPMMQLMQKKNVPSWYESLKQAKELGNVKIHACSLMYGIMDLKKEDLDPIVDDTIGAGAFLELARDSKVTLFI